MAIYRKTKNGTWYFSVYVPGQPRRLRGSCNTTIRAEAQLIEQTMRLAASRKAPKEHVINIIEALYGETSRPDIPLDAVEAACARIGQTAGKPPSPRTRQARRTALGHLSRWAAKYCPRLSGARGIGRAEAQAFAAQLVRDGLSDKSRANLLGDLSAMWNTLKRENDGMDNPWPLARPMRVEQRRLGTFTPDEARRIFEAGDRDGEGWGLAARIAAATGLRYGDIAHLRFGNVRNGAIILQPRKTAAFGINVFLPLPPLVLEMIGTGAPDAFILPEHASGYGRGWVGKHPFSAVLRLAGIDPGAGYSFHSWRHYFRTQLARAGVRDDVAMRLGGWTQRDTAARYDHDDHRDELAKAIKSAWALAEGEDAQTGAAPMAAAR